MTTDPHAIARWMKAHPLVAVYCIPIGAILIIVTQLAAVDVSWGLFWCVWAVEMLLVLGLVHKFLGDHHPKPMPPGPTGVHEYVGVISNGVSVWHSDEMLVPGDYVSLQGPDNDLRLVPADSPEAIAERERVGEAIRDLLDRRMAAYNTPVRKVYDPRFRDHLSYHHWGYRVLDAGGLWVIEVYYDEDGEIVDYQETDFHGRTLMEIEAFADAMKDAAHQPIMEPFELKGLK